MHTTLATFEPHSGGPRPALPAPRRSSSLGAVQALAHDLRGPLTNLSLLIERLAGCGREDAQAAIAAIVAKADCLVARADEMLRAAITDSRDDEVGSDERDTDTTDATQIDLGALIDAAISLNQPFADARGVRLQTGLAGPLSVVVDGDLILRALDNLLSNAIKHSPAHGTVTCTACLDTDSVTIAVRDEGPGFTTDDLTRVFQPFARLSATDRHGAPSHGIGLAIVRSVAERHGGRVVAANRRDRSGAVLSLVLPRHLHRHA